MFLRVPREIGAVASLIKNYDFVIFGREIRYIEIEVIFLVCRSPGDNFLLEELSRLCNQSRSNSSKIWACHAPSLES